MSLLRRRSREEAPSLNEVLLGADLPVFPKVAAAALERLGSPEVDLGEVGDLLVADAGISARLLRMVNSAAVGTRREVESVHQAVTLLGMASLESTLIAVGVQEALPSAPAGGFDPAGFWRAAARRASIASAFAGRIVPSKRSETFTAALLQDMAVPVLASSRPGYDQLLQQWREGHGQLHTMEQDTFGSSHATVAAQMCDVWEFPASLTRTIEAHHEAPDSDVHGAFVQLVSGLRDVEDDTDREHMLELAASTLDLDLDETQALVEDAEEEAKGLGALLS